MKPHTRELQVRESTTTELDKPGASSLGRAAPSELESLRAFSLALARHQKVWLTGSVILGIIGMITAITGYPVPGSAMLFVFVFLFLKACFNAWKELYRELTEVRAQTVTAQVSVRGLQLTVRPNPQLPRGQRQWTFQAHLYVTPARNNVLVLPFHKAQVWLQATGESPLFVSELLIYFEQSDASATSPDWTTSEITVRSPRMLKCHGEVFAPAWGDPPPGDIKARITFTDAHDEWTATISSELVFQGAAGTILGWYGFGD